MRARLLAALIAAALAASLVLGAVAVSASAATSGLLGGLDLAGYCQGLGDQGTTATGPATLMLGGIIGPNYAYGNWACVRDDGTTVPIAATGPAPSMTDACLNQYPGAASFAYPSDPDDAYSWNCYLLPPAAGPGAPQQVKAALSALVGTDPVQAEIAALRGLVDAGKVRQALAGEARFLVSRSTQELITDVLGGYKLAARPYQLVLTAELAQAVARAVLNQP